LHWVIEALASFDGADHHRAKSNGAKREPGKRLARREDTDKSLLETMETDPSGSIGAWATAIGRSRTSAVSALHRLRDAGLAESVKGKWHRVEPLREPPPRWVEPISAARERRAHAHA
jgi:hypothetical protein